MFASKLIENANIIIDDDGTLPKLQAIKSHGKPPVVLEGRFSRQLDYVIGYINNNINLADESVGFLHAKGGGWFDSLRMRLRKENLPFVEITGESCWPPVETNIVLSTIHSAKGLEFDHVLILGLEEQHFSFSVADSQDSDYASIVKLISMGITRAKAGVILGYKSDTRPFFISHLDKNTFQKVVL